MASRDAPTAPMRRTICPIIGVRSMIDAHTGLAVLKTASFALWLFVSGRVFFLLRKHMLASFLSFEDVLTYDKVMR